MTDDMTSAYLSEVHQLLAFVKAKAAQALERPGADEASALWKATYGQVEVEASNLEELAKAASELMYLRAGAATMVVIDLALRVAQLEGKTIVQVLDETELHLAEGDEPL